MYVIVYHFLLHKHWHAVSWDRDSIIAIVLFGAPKSSIAKLPGAQNMLA